MTIIDQKPYPDMLEAKVIEAKATEEKLRRLRRLLKEANLLANELGTKEGRRKR